MVERIRIGNLFRRLRSGVFATGWVNGRLMLCRPGLLPGEPDGLGRLGLDHDRPRESCGFAPVASVTAQSRFWDRRPRAPQLRISTPSLLRTRTRSAPATLVCKKIFLAFALAPSGSRAVCLI